jgi:undecaprenyl-diphosphatase
VAHELGVLEAVGLGLLQGVAVVFPISDLGHGVLAGSLGNGAGDDIAPANAGYLYACLRVGIGVALFVYFWRDWARVGRGLVATVTRNTTDRAARRWAWLIVLAAVPGSIGIAVLAPHARSLTEHPAIAAACLAANGVVMLTVWWWWRRSPRAGGLSGSHRAPLSRGEDADAFANEASTLRPARMLLLGLLPIASLVPGISGVGLAVAAGLIWGLTQEQAARVALLVLTPIVLTWGASDLPDLFSAQFDGVRSAVLLASGVAALAAYLATALVVRYFLSASLRPFGYYCVIAGGAALFALTR